MTCTIAVSQETFESLADIVPDVADPSARFTFVDRPEWLKSWWDEYSAGSELKLLSVRDEMGAAADATGSLARLAQSVAGLITFYTTGPQEARAWQLEAGTPAPLAAGRKIHTDMERGFIRAEVTSYQDFLDAEGKFPEARRRGTLRQEGKTYIIQDGDVVTFLFNVSGR